VLVDDTTPWLRDYRGLWVWTPVIRSAASVPRPGRAMSAAARCGSPGPTRWMGRPGQGLTLAKAEQQAIAERMAVLDEQIAAAGEELDDVGDTLRGAQAGLRALRDAGLRGDPATLAELETSAGQLRLRRRALAEEREVLVRAARLGLPPGTRTRICGTGPCPTSTRSGPASGSSSSGRPFRPRSCWPDSP